MPRKPERAKSQKGIQQEIHCRVVVLGAPGVGKSSIISQFLYERFTTNYNETIEELHRGQYNMDGIKFKLDILDTAGHREFPAMRKLAISSSDAFILVYTLTDSSSFEEVQALRDEIIAERKNVPIVIVANKADIGPDIPLIDKTMQEVIACVDWESGFVEASAKDNINIDCIFHELFRISYFSQSKNNNRDMRS